MSQEIRVNAFVSTSPIHQSPGMWRHPRDTSLAFTDLEHWIELAQVLEESLIDAVFIADSIGVNDIHGGSVDAAIRYKQRYASGVLREKLCGPDKTFLPSTHPGGALRVGRRRTAGRVTTILGRSL